MKWFWRLTLACGLVVAMVAFMPMPMVLASTTATVTVTATPNYAGGDLGAPTDFALTYVTDTQVDITWVKDGGATNTLVRAKVGEYPISVTDGYEVYFGAGTSTSDTGLNLDETAAPVYYRAWSEDGGGGYSSNYAEDLIEGAGMRLIALIALPIGLMIMGYVFKRQGLSFGAVGGWILLAVYAYGLSATQWDVYYGIFWLGIAMTIVSAVEAMSIRVKSEEVEEETSFARNVRRMTEHREKMEKYREALEGKSGRPKRRRREIGGEGTRLT